MSIPFKTILFLLACFVVNTATAQASLPDTIYIVKGQDTLTMSQAMDISARMRDTFCTVVCHSKNKKLKNLSLSLTRAISICQQLEDRGINKARLQLVYGIKGPPNMVIVRYSTDEETRGTKCETPPHSPRDNAR